LNVNCHECLYKYCEGFNVVLYKMLNCYEMFVWVLQVIYCYVILNAKLLWNICTSIMKGLLVCYSEC
jgi:hypothetical protein